MLHHKYISRVVDNWTITDGKGTLYKQQSYPRAYRLECMQKHIRGIYYLYCYFSQFSYLLKTQRVTHRSSLYSCWSKEGIHTQLSLTQTWYANI